MSGHPVVTFGCQLCTAHTAEIDKRQMNQLKIDSCRWRMRSCAYRFSQ